MLRKALGAALVLGCTVLSLPASAQQQTTTIQAGGTRRVLPVYPLTSADKTRIAGGNAAEVAGGLTVTYGPNDPPASASVKGRMSAVQDQGSRGTCSAHATIALYEKAQPSAGELSEQCLALRGASEDPAWLVNLASYANANGLYTETACPYPGRARNDVPASLGQPTVRVTARPTVLSASSFNSVREIRKHIAAGRAVAVSVYVTNESAWGNDASSVIDVPATSVRCTSSCPGHSVVIVGYDNQSGTFEFKNSWGKGWKNSGYGRMTYKYFLESFMSGPTANSIAL